MGQPVLITLSVLCLALWLPALQASQWSDWQLWAALPLTLLNAALLMVLLYNLTITHTRSAMPILCYLLLSALLLYLPNTSPLIGQIVVLIVQALLFLLQSVYRQENAVEQAFLMGLIVALSTLLLPDLALLLAFVWVALLLQRAFGFRVASATLIGVAVVALWGWLFNILGWIDILPIDQLYIHQSIALLHPAQQAQSPSLAQLPLQWWMQCSIYAVLLVFSLIALFGSLIGLTREGVQIQQFFIQIVILFFIALPLTFFYNPNFTSLQPILLYTATILLTFFFVRRPSVFTGILFLLFLLTPLLLLLNL